MTVQSLDEIQQKVLDIVAEALDFAPEDVHPHSSLMDDLGAESIDFIDIVFRLESTFETMVPSEDLWAGSQKMDPNDPDSIARGVEQLRASMPEFAWERFPGPVTKRDLPRLITVHSIAAYLHSHLAAEAAAKG
ncbi:MAG TPA: acyl carrier protein [Thermoanaerobaculia bacterium]|jgi:acyl carrier protein